MTEISNEQLEELDKLLKGSQEKWNLQLGYISWEDIAQQIRLHVWKKFQMFNPERGKFSTWAKRIIHHQIINARKKHFLRYAAPCCNCPESMCWKNPANKTAECPIREKWNKNRVYASNIHFASSLDETYNDNEEVAKIQVSGEILDMNEATQKLHQFMLGTLEDRLKEFYILKYIDEKSDQEIAKKFGFITNEKNRAPGYRQIYNMDAEIRSVASFIVSTKDIF